ncbi:hypothetical protein EDB85DRAFT_2162692 [Lactarius pseudohatsudake]|nr:hypothetical protein EDB85DRAFT_2162692 [Lactarius pseudohatsudake]
MDPAQHLSNTPGQQRMPVGYPLPPPHAAVPHLGYLPHGVPYPPLTPGPMPYPPIANGFSPQYQLWPPYAPYYPHPLPIPTLTPTPTPTRQPPATPVRTPGSARKRYVNSQREPGVWEFDVSVASSEAKSVFKGHSAMSWDELQTEVLRRLHDTVLPVQLGYKISGDLGKMSYLSSEEEWEAALTRLNAKIIAARKNAVSLEIQNLTKAPSKASKASASKGKRRREDDIPPPMNPEQGAVYQAYKELEIALKCEAHKGHCFVDRLGGRDNHKRLDHRAMTFWAKKMTLNEAAVDRPPNLKPFDQPPTSKRARNSHGVPEVHVAVNIALPSPGSTAGASVTSVTSKTHPATRSRQRPTSMPNAATPTPTVNTIDLPVRMLLELMDIHNPSPTFNYVDMESELVDFGMRTVMQVYEMHQVLLETVGGIGKEGAHSLHAYVKKWLLPVIRPNGEGSTVGGMQEEEAVEVVEVVGPSRVPGDRKGKGWMLKEESHEAIFVWSSDEEEGEQKRQGWVVKDEDPFDVENKEDDWAATEATSVE